ncbi:MAG: hypothetical protein R3B06_30975 [Kofleriaceae bacterium]
MAVLITADDRLIVVLFRDALDLWDDLRRAYLDRRPTRMDPTLGAYPETTNADVAQVIAAFDNAMRRDYVPKVDPTLAADWRLLQDRIRARLLRPADAAYPDNAGLWLRDLFGIARRLGPMFTEPPTTAEKFRAATKEILLGPAKVVADVAVGASKVAGDAVSGVAGSLGGGLWNAVKVPLLIGGGLVAAVVILPRVWPAERGTHG